MRVTVKFWRTQAARSETVDPPERGTCESLDGWGWLCLTPAVWVLAWTGSKSGLPGTGEAYHAFTCDAHLVPRLGEIPYEYVPYVTLTPYKEARS